MGAGGYDRVDVLVLRPVSDEDHAVGLDLVQDLLQLGHQGQVGTVPDLLVAADERHIGIVAVLLDLQADAHGGIEGVEVGILRVRDAERGGGIQAVLDADDGGVHLPLDAEIVVPVDDQNQSLPHERVEERRR